jgi:hypothetical protein
MEGVRRARRQVEERSLMVRTLSIRSKLLALVALPMVVLLALSALVVRDAAGEATRAKQLVSLTDTAVAFSQTAHALQDERRLTMELADEAVQREELVAGRRARTAHCVRSTKPQRPTSAPPSSSPGHATAPGCCTRGCGTAGGVRRRDRSRC